MHMAEAGHRVQHEEHHKDEEEDLVADVKRCEVVQHLSPLTMCETIRSVTDAQQHRHPYFCARSACIWLPYAAGLLGADLLEVSMREHSASQGMAVEEKRVQLLFQMCETVPPGQAVCLSTSQPALAT